MAGWKELRGILYGARLRIRIIYRAYDGGRV